MPSTRTQRPKPLTPKSGVTKNGKRRYDDGGKIKKKKN